MLRRAELHAPAGDVGAGWEAVDEKAGIGPEPGIALVEPQAKRRAKNIERVERGEQFGTMVVTRPLLRAAVVASKPRIQRDERLQPQLQPSGGDRFLAVNRQRAHPRVEQPVLPRVGAHELQRTAPDFAAGSRADTAGIGALAKTTAPNATTAPDRQRPDHLTRATARPAPRR